MGRQRKLGTLGAVLALLVLSAVPGLAQNQRRSHAPKFNSGGGYHGQIHRQMPHQQHRFNQLSPEERQVFRRNAERWLQMNPEQRQMLRQREIMRRQQMKAEAEMAMRQSGLRLDGGARNQFEARYLQERRRIERQLRLEAEMRRQQELPQLNEKLRNEFQSKPGGNGTKSPNPGGSGRNRK